MHSASVRTVTPSASRMPRTASETSASSRRDQPRALLDHGDRGAEAAEGLGELEADVAAADDHQVPRQRVEREQRGVGRASARRATPGRSGTAARAPTLMKMRSAARTRSPTATSRGPVKRAWPSITVTPASPPSQSSSPAPALRDDAGIRGACTAAKSMPTGPATHAEVGGAAGEMRDPGARHQRLGRRQPVLMQVPPKWLRSIDGHPLACRRQPDRERRAGLAGADDDGVEFFADAGLPARRSEHAASLRDWRARRGGGGRRRRRRRRAAAAGRSRSRAPATTATTRKAMWKSRSSMPPPCSRPARSSTPPASATPVASEICCATELIAVAWLASRVVDVGEDHRVDAGEADRAKHAAEEQAGHDHAAPASPG